MHSVNQMQRHVGRDIANNGRVIVVKKSVDDSSGLALVIYLESIPMIDRDEVMILLQSEEGQREEDFGNAMYKKGNMLAYFYAKNFLKAVPINRIEMMPMPNRFIKLEEIVNGTRISKGLPPVNTNIVESTEAQKIKESIFEGLPSHVQDKPAVARTYLEHAKMLEKQAALKRKEAYKLDPTLAPVRKKSKK